MSLLTKYPNLTFFSQIEKEAKSEKIWRGWLGGGEGEGSGSYGGGVVIVRKHIFEWQFYSSRRTTVPNNSKVRA